MNNYLRKVIEDNDWNIYEIEGATDIELEKYSPLGEDFIIYLRKENLIGDLENLIADFNPDRHAIEWYEEGSTNFTIRELLDDSDAILEMMKDLLKSIRKNINGFTSYWLDNDTLYLESIEMFTDENGDMYWVDMEYWNDEKSYHFLQNYGDESLAFSAGDKVFLKHSKLIDKGIELIKKELKRVEEK